MATNDDNRSPEQIARDDQRGAHLRDQDAQHGGRDATIRAAYDKVHKNCKPGDRCSCQK